MPTSMPKLALAVTTYAAAGVVNSYFFAATLAARSEYSPIAARGQIFVWAGALEITAGSAETAVAGDLIGTSLHLPTIVPIALPITAAIASEIDR
jgi:hypothetical protein